jgi:deoxycytidine triphosphate deaminase
MAVLNDKRIKEEIEVYPFCEKCVNPTSLDLRLNPNIRRPRWYWRFPIVRRFAWWYFTLRKIDTSHVLTDPKTGTRVANPIYWGDLKEHYRFTLMPGDVILASSIEVVHQPENIAAALYSKSSAGRTLLEHLHAGFGDAGFIGEWTFEFQNAGPWPLVLYAGNRYVQLVFMDAEQPETPYAQTGHYQHQRGATPPRA